MPNSSAPRKKPQLRAADQRRSGGSQDRGSAASYTLPERRSDAPSSQNPRNPLGSAPAPRSHPRHQQQQYSTPEQSQARDEQDRILFSCSYLELLVECSRKWSRVASRRVARLPRLAFPVLLLSSSSSSTPLARERERARQGQGEFSRAFFFPLSLPGILIYFILSGAMVVASRWGSGPDPSPESNPIFIRPRALDGVGPRWRVRRPPRGAGVLACGVWRRWPRAPRARHLAVRGRFGRACRSFVRRGPRPRAHERRFPIRNPRYLAAVERNERARSKVRATTPTR